MKNSIFWKRIFGVMNIMIAGTASCQLSANPLTILGKVESGEVHVPVRFTVRVERTWEHPHRATEVTLDLVWVTPGGKQLRVPCYQESTDGRDASYWVGHFSPMEIGIYEGFAELVSHDIKVRSDELLMEVKHGDRPGFLRLDSDWTLRFDNGEPFRGIGQNIGWESRNNDDSRYFRELHEREYFNYEYLIGRLREQGGNFFRTWMCSWNLPLEWKQVKDTARYEADPHPYNRGAIRRMDELVALCEREGVYLMLTLDHAGGYLGGEWLMNNYHAQNGGPVTLASEFFTNAAARQQYKDRLRQIIARWGHSPTLAVIEFFNEVDHVAFSEADPVPAEVVTAWHAEMSAYLRSIDPQQRLITTSISHRDLEGLNDIETIDINQRHVYGHITTLPAIIESYRLAHGRPYVIGEYGHEWDWSKNFDDFADAMDLDYQRGLWLGLFSPTPILPMTWWWEYFDARDTTRLMKPVVELHERMLAAGGGSYERLQVATPEVLLAWAVRCGASCFVYAIQAEGLAEPLSIELNGLEGKWRWSRLDVRDGSELESGTEVATENGVTLDLHSPEGNDLLWQLVQVEP
jgi:hypothetical protein